MSEIKILRTISQSSAREDPVSSTRSPLKTFGACGARVMKHLVGGGRATWGVGWGVVVT